MSVMYCTASNFYTIFIFSKWFYLLFFLLFHLREIQISQRYMRDLWHLICAPVTSRTQI